MNPPLTRRQQAIYDYLREQGRFDQPPTLEELCQALGLRSRGSLHKHIQALVGVGLVEPLQGRQRGIRLCRDAEADSLPLLGRIAAGHPIEVVMQQERIAVPPELRTRADCYLLEVRGDSMVEDGILDGDWVVVEQRSHARDGEVVVALVDGSEATLKRIEQKPGEVLLHPANSAMAVQRYPSERVTVQGVLVGLMRRYR